MHVLLNATFTYDISCVLSEGRVVVNHNEVATVLAARHPHSCRRPLAASRCHLRLQRDVGASPPSAGKRHAHHVTLSRGVTSVHVGLYISFDIHLVHSITLVVSSLFAEKTVN